MAFREEHELHKRRKGRNRAVGLILAGFVILVFAVSIVKLSQPQSVDIHAPNYSNGASEWAQSPTTGWCFGWWGWWCLWAFYEAYNPTDRPIAGSAGYNVTPFSAGGYFTKIDCFCFELQVLQPGERVLMPVTFYVDPEIVTDREAHNVAQITLSYTFYETELPDLPELAQVDTANNTRTN